MKQLTLDDWMQEIKASKDSSMLKKTYIQNKNQTPVDINKPSEEFLDIYQKFKETDSFHSFNRMMKVLTNFNYYFNGHSTLRKETDPNVMETESYTVSVSSLDQVILYCDENNKTYEINLVWFEGKNVFTIPVSIERQSGQTYHHICTVKIGKWKKVNKIVYPFTCIQKDIISILEKEYPYVYPVYQNYLEKEFFEVRRNRYTTIKDADKTIAAIFLMAPELEQLVKAGYEPLVDSYMKSFIIDRGLLKDIKKNTDIMNRLICRGSKLKNIFKTSKKVYMTLKNESILTKWDFYRKLDKQRNVSLDILQQIYEANYLQKELTLIYTILGKKYQGKEIFTFDTLQNYLRRIDMYEAIPASEGLQLLNDYLQNCDVLNIRPRIDGDSLKREHDITSRLVREHRDEIMAKEMEGACKKLEKYNYEEEIYLVRGIKDYDDLIDEAKQQHNCVAGYAKSIISGRSLIYVMREKKDPDKSLITIELSPDGKTIRQKLMAYNQPIRNKSQTEFINRWNKYRQIS